MLSIDAESHGRCGDSERSDDRCGDSEQTEDLDPGLYSAVSGVPHHTAPSYFYFLEESFIHKLLKRYKLRTMKSKKQLLKEKKKTFKRKK